MPLAGTAVSRIRAKVEAALEDKDYYHAHQLYRTLNFRLAAQQNYEDLIQMLHEGINLLIDHKQFTSAHDLALLLLKALNDGKISCDRTDVLGMLGTIFGRLNPSSVAGIKADVKNHVTETANHATQAAELVVDRNVIIQQAVDWSKKVDPDYGHGCPHVHKVFASAYWTEKSYVSARYHFMLSSDGQTSADFLIEYQQRKGYATEVDLFIGQAVLQYLSLNNEPTARDAFSAYTKGHPQIRADGPPYKLPLLDFLWLLLLSVRETPRRLTAFTVLVEQYQPSITRDPSYTGYLDKIGQVYFDVPAKRQGGGFLGNILSSIFEDDDGPDLPHACPAPVRKDHKPVVEDELD